MTKPKPKPDAGERVTQEMARAVYLDLGPLRTTAAVFERFATPAFDYPPLHRVRRWAAENHWARLGREHDSRVSEKAIAAIETKHVAELVSLVEAGEIFVRAAFARATDLLPVNSSLVEVVEMTINAMKQLAVHTGGVSDRTERTEDTAAAEARRFELRNRYGLNASQHVQETPTGTIDGPAPKSPPKPH